MSKGSQSASVLVCLVVMRRPPGFGSCIPYVDFAIFESFLQIIVDGFVRDLADQSEIRYSDLLLLVCVESRFLDIGLSS